MNEFISASTPAVGESPATVELRSIISDPGHRLHSGLMRGDPEVDRYLNDLYQKHHGRPNGTPSNEAGPDPQPPLLTTEDRVAHAAYEDFLKRHFGDEHEAVMTNVNDGARTLFTTPETVKALDVFSEAITNLGPDAEILSVRFLADLGQLARTQR